ncbi:VWA domain-containing protein [Methanoplanus sp. FWC-SCC4]|uniref:VWA domain-containing protein n=1 Tax=Methanochimaera problematica TaxID=2609417 RepID=A0AA97FAC1_9EURY|nr:VWA domain-containing protein [Methanoplanus sp. FWC-SCC4]WOF15309.1 VWA domain-containing protein [Methanoplanus sp. FWC-SCC4]
MTGFDDPLWLAGLLLIPLLFVYHHHYKGIRQKSAIEFSRISYIKAAQEGTKKSRQEQILLALSLIAVAMIFIGLANPHIPLENTKKGANVIFALDISGSMLAGDYKPDRLGAAKDSVAMLIKNLEKEDYVGVVTFEGGASSAAYLSPDKERVLNKLESIRSKGGNTAIGDGLALAADMAVSIPGRKNVVILLSDGENNAGFISPEEALSFANERGVQVFTIGVGSEKPVIYDYDMFKNPLYAVLDENTLKNIADKTGGIYYKSVDESTLHEIYSNLNDEIERETEETGIAWLFFLLSGIMIISGFLIRYGKRGVI